MLNKEKVLRGLYFIRAALSKISQCNDKVEWLLKKKKCTEEKIREKPTIEEQGSSDEQELLWEIDRVSHKIDWLNNFEIEDAETKLWIEKENRKKYRIKAGLLFFSSPVLYLLSIFYTRNVYAMSLYYGIGLIIGAIIFIRRETYYKHRFRGLSVRLFDAEQEKRSLLDKKTSLEEKISSIERKMNEEHEKNLSEWMETLWEIPTSLSNATQEAFLIYENLKRVAILDERDWQYLDLIIYEIETGRADSIKEALQQADFYIRHNELKTALVRATAAVCDTIEFSIGLLTERLSTEINSLRESVVSLTAGQTKFAESLVDSQEMIESLISKQNQASESLVSDMRKIREFHEKQYYNAKIN